MTVSGVTARLRNRLAQSVRGGNAAVYAAEEFAFCHAEKRFSYINTRGFMIYSARQFRRIMNQSEEETDSAGAEYDADGKAPQDSAGASRGDVLFLSGSFGAYPSWERDLLRAAAEFRKKYGRWPSSVLASRATCERCRAEAERKSAGRSDSKIEDFDDADEIFEDSGQLSLFEDDEPAPCGAEENYDAALEFDGDDAADESDQPSLFEDDFGEEFDDDDEIFGSGRTADDGAQPPDEFDTDSPTDIPIDKIVIETAPNFRTPFFTLKVLIDDSLAKDAFRLTADAAR